MSTLNKLPDSNQLQGHMQYFIAYLVVHNRAELLKVIRDNGILLNNPNDQQIITAVFVGIKKSANFRKDLRSLMAAVAGKNLSLQKSINSPSGKKTIDDFVKTGATLKDGFSNFGEDPADPHQWNPGDEEEREFLQEPKTLSEVVVFADKKPSSTKKSFADTGLGNFLSGLFTKDNIEKAAGVGIDLLGQKLSANANTQQANAATQLQLAQTEKYRQQIVAEETRNKWLVPALIVGGVLIAVIVIAVVVSKKKAA